MQRRRFLEVSAACALPAVAASGHQPESAKAVVEGHPLTLPKTGPVSVAIAVSEGTTWIDFVGPLAAFETWRRDPATGKYARAFSTYLVSDSLDVRSNLKADHTFDSAPTPQVILVPAQRGSDALTAWLRKTAPATDVTMSVCIGAEHLAKAGLLDGLKATTHHESIDSLEKKYPAVHWVRSKRFVEGPKISTGGGLTAGIDLGLRIVERYYGRDWAIQVAEHMEYESRSWVVG